MPDGFCSHRQTVMTNKVVPNMLATLENITARLQPFQYLNTHGLYNALHLRQLSEELQELQQITSAAHRDRPGAETQRLNTEVQISYCTHSKGGCGGMCTGACVLRSPFEVPVFEY